MTEFANTTDEPCYAVIFTSKHAEGARQDGYDATAARMAELVALQPGFLGMESARGDDGVGITVCYWRSLEDIAAWKAVEEHQLAQQQGRDRWYAAYRVRIARIEREYGDSAI
jgi:heme-degrading monooxygenase HmoA